MYVLRIPRHACSPRDCARAGDLWRLIQEAAVLHSTECGWPPSRYRDVGTGFVVREMTAVHAREARYGEELRVTTQVAETRREMLMRRETIIEGVTHATADWVHIGTHGGPARAPRELADAFPVEPREPPPFPSIVEQEPRPLPDLHVTPWWTEMDPLGHVNHPRYLDWAEEAVAQWMAQAGLDPIGIVPVAERVRFRSAAKAGNLVVVTTTLSGRSGDAAVFHARMRRGNTTICDATLVRTHLGGPLP